MRRLSWVLVLSASVAFAAGCGDDGGDGPDSDAGSDGSMMGGACNPPSGAPMPEQMEGPCCYRKSNADRRANPEFRVAGLTVNSPPSLGSTLVGNLLQSSVDDEEFNWLVRVEGADTTDVTITTGYGVRMSDGSYRFATAMDDEDWVPATVMGTLESGMLSSQPAGDPIVLPIFDTEGEMVVAQLPLMDVQVVEATLTEERSCVGARSGGAWDTSQGTVRAYITVEAATMTQLDVATLDTELCAFIAKLDSPPDGGMASCSTTPRSDWDTDNLPDSLCDDSGCTQGECDPMSDCNAWQLEAGIAAQGVEIAE